MNKLRIVLVDDHEIVRQGLRTLVERQPDMEVVAEAGDGRQALNVIPQVKPDVVVMDVSMPELNGINATRQLLGSDPTLKILALTVHEERSYLRELLAVGASGYLLKRIAADELVYAIRRVAEGGVYLDGRLLPDVLDTYFRPVGREALEVRSHLTSREEEVIRLIARGFSNKEIATKLSVSVKTVETHKARSLDKLGLKSRAEIVRYAMNQGWLMDDA
jgi:two-component system response regulator NreC